jgi:hypothetical protein
MLHRLGLSPAARLADSAASVWMVAPAWAHGRAGEELQVLQHGAHSRVLTTRLTLLGMVLPPDAEGELAVPVQPRRHRRPRVEPLGDVAGRPAADGSWRAAAREVPRTAAAQSYDPCAGRGLPSCVGRGEAPGRFGPVSEDAAIVADLLVVHGGSSYGRAAVCGRCATGRRLAGTSAWRRTAGR